MRFRVAAAVMAIGVLGSAASAQTERILSFHSDVTVHEDGWLTVSETIKVRSANIEIKRGIYRDFPVMYRDRWWSTVRVPFKVLSVRRDGKGEPYHIEGKGRDRRVYIGRADRLIPPGVYTYTLRYKTARQLGFFKDHDELYWNVTGNHWDFPIDKASATVTLPRQVAPDRMTLKAFTGPAGARGTAYTSSVDEAGKVRFEATRALRTREGLTIVVMFPKGLVVPPAAGESLKALLTDNPMLVIGVVGLLVVVLYYFVGWLRVGRDPPKGIVIPLFEPAAGLSPAATRYVRDMGFDKKCLAAAVVNMAVKGYLTIAEDDGDYSLTRNDAADEAKLSRGEKKVARKLLGHGGSIELDNANHYQFRKAIQDLKNALGDECHGRYFFSNLKWFIPGIALSVLTLVGIALVGFLSDRDPGIGFLAIWLSIWSVGVLLVLRQARGAWRAVRAGAGGLAGKAGSAVVLTIFAVPFCIVEVVVLALLVRETSVWLLPPLLALGAVNVWFHHLLKRPTVAGRKAMDGIEGFRMYLGTAEQERLEYATSGAAAPERTPELFERYLPYGPGPGRRKRLGGAVLRRAGGRWRGRAGVQPRVVPRHGLLHAGGGRVCLGGGRVVVQRPVLGLDGAGLQQRRRRRRLLGRGRRRWWRRWMVRLSRSDEGAGGGKDERGRHS